MILAEHKRRVLPSAALAARPSIPDCLMDTETVKRIAYLARIDVADGELEPLAD